MSAPMVASYNFVATVILQCCDHRICHANVIVNSVVLLADTILAQKLRIMRVSV